ncbi:MAG TPA: TadE/TadG family type IV pilus assembly protein [Microthrixaceae bacterium]|jgi:Flp pilus assembly protein TadG|nr:TadE/TadG family type IV pilus assembly protein [Microthrixaceae bacterium]HQF93124.1 TadE/TadG family type IV pilus assembly protein [Microthrixaceae bacterium]
MTGGEALRFRHERSLTRSERGAVVVESALALPLFLLLIFGTMEFGLAFRSYLTLANATRDAARFASTLGKDADADFQIVNEITGNLSGFKTGAIKKIIIFKATGPTSTTSSGALAACRTGSVTGLCNTYIAGSISTNSANYGCNYTSPDRFWCPAGRKVAVSDPPDYIGVYIETRHTGVTGVIGMTRDFSDEFVMRLEPVRA